jgi:hypothetical protein
MKPTTESDYAALATPLGFVKGVLRLPTYAWQDRIYCDLEQPGFLAIRAANGVGKSSRIGAPFALWNALVHPGSLTLVSAGVHRQVVEVFQSLHAHRHRFPQWEFLADEIRTHRQSRIVGFTADRPELFEGFHSDHLAIVLDECKSIPDGVYAAALGCQPERLLLLSSPGGRAGFFYEAFTSRRKFFKTHAITAHDAPHVSPQWIAEVIEQYGETHPFTRSAVYGEFAELDSDTVIPLTKLETCLASPPAFQDGEASAFCDFGAGAAENVLSIRRGNRIEIAGAWRESDTMKACGKFITLFRQHDLTAHQVQGDGMGTVFCDCLAENGWPIERFHGGRPASNGQAYANTIAEAWYETRRQIEKQLVIFPHDQILIGQLTSRKGFCNSRGQLCLESKEDMAKRGLKSPDRADAVVGCLLPVRTSGVSIVRQSQYDRFDCPRVHARRGEAMF